MKKFVIGLLILIPVIILLTISVSGMIISAEVSIAIESFVLKHQGEEVTSVTVQFSQYSVYAAKYQLIPVYLPGAAQVTGFYWYSDNESVATVSEEGAVTFLDCGIVTITAESMDNRAIRASCAFFVEDDKIHDLSLYDYRASDKAIETLTMARYEETQLRVDVNPYNALAESPVFHSSDESVFICTAEGVIRAVGEGNAVLTVSARSIDGGGKERTVEIHVAGSRLTTRSTVYACGDSVDLSPYIVQGTAIGGNVVELNDETTEVTVTDGDKRETITVRKVPSEHTLVVRDMDAWLAGEWSVGRYIAVNSSRRMIATDAVTDQTVEGTTLRTSDDSIVRVEGDRIYAVRAGRAVITLEKEGYRAFETEVRVETPLSYFDLNIDAKDDIIGLYSDRVFGTWSYYDGELVHGIRIRPKNIYPEGCDETNFSYFTESEYATVDRTGLVTFRDGAEGQTVTVLVKSNFSTNSISRAYTFKYLVKGINIGMDYGANVYDKESGRMPSFEPYYDAIRATNGPNEYAIVFQTNVYMPPAEYVDAIEGKNQKLGFFHDIYGNGYKLDGQLYQYHFESRLMEEADDEEYEKNPGVTGVTIRDLYVQSYAPKSSESAAAFQELMTYGGTPIRTYFKEHTDYRIDFKYCVFQYAYSHVVAIGGTTTFDGCVFRNSVGPAMLIESLHEQPNFITVKNCIFSNMLSFAVMLSNGTVPLPKSERVQYNTLEWLGENYIYNWKKPNEIRLDIIPNGVLGDKYLDLALAELNNKLSESAHMSFEKGRNAEFIVEQDGNRYVNMGGFCMSFWADLNTKENVPRTIGADGKPYLEDGFHLFYDKKHTSYMRLELSTTNLGRLSQALARDLNIDVTKPCYMIMNKGENGIYNTLPGEKYAMDETTFARLHGRA
ncbi:MAG: Ig-like domain-containing protein [Clostridia bacterium]|nr:Ig-like domain-containing protein [Clostridia bacterium]